MDLSHSKAVSRKAESGKPKKNSKPKAESGMTEKQ